jgi:hypothetical protein
MLSTNPNLFKEGAPNAKPQGVHISKDGEIIVLLNIHLDMRLADSGESIRHFYIPFEVKLKAPEPLRYDPKLMEFWMNLELVSVKTTKT